MPRFSRASTHQLRTCDQRLQDLFQEVVKRYDCTIIKGHRGQREQDQAFAEGKSKLKWPNGNHNQYPSKALDAAPYPIDWNNMKRFYHFAGYVQRVAEEMGIPLRWGGDWDGDLDFSDQTFNDLVHFEIKEN